MTEQELKTWREHNATLQMYYKKYLLSLHSPKSTREKESALIGVQNALQWPPFMNYVCEHGGLMSGISRYGLDLMTEQAIEHLDKIARGEIYYNYK